MSLSSLFLPLFPRFTDQILLSLPRYHSTASSSSLSAPLSLSQPNDLIAEVAVCLSSLDFHHEGFCRVAQLLLHRWQERQEEEEEANQRREASRRLLPQCGFSHAPEKGVAHAQETPEEVEADRTEDEGGAARRRRNKRSSRVDRGTREAAPEAEEEDSRRGAEEEEEAEKKREEREEGKLGATGGFVDPWRSLQVQIRLIYGLVGGGRTAPLTQQ